VNVRTAGLLGGPVWGMPAESVLHKLGASAAVPLVLSGVS
jgi:hypothetical protein